MPKTGNPAIVVLLIGLGVAVVVGGLVRAFSMRATADKVFIGTAATVIAAGLFEFVSDEYAHGGPPF